MAVKKFLIIGLPRSGSTYLATLLNSHKDIECSGELFNPYAIVGIGEKTDDVDAVVDRDVKPLKFFNEFFAKDSKAKALGFKFMIGHNIKVLREIGKNPDISIIYIFRKNKLAQISSWMTAVCTGNWAKSNKAPESGGAALLDAGPRAISQKWHEYATYDFLFMSWLKSLPNRRLIVDYNSVFDADFPQKVCRFLDVEYDEEMKSNLVKQSSNKVIDRFEHKKPISEYFKRRGLGNWLGNELQDNTDDNGSQ